MEELPKRICSANKNIHAIALACEAGRRTPLN
jgi:hypothetical protein